MTVAACDQPVSLMDSLSVPESWPCKIVIVVSELPNERLRGSTPDATLVLTNAKLRDARHPPNAERRALAFCVFEKTRGRVFVPNVLAANGWMRGTVAKGRGVWNSGLRMSGCGGT